MPYKSEAQRGWAHTKEGTKALGGPSKVHEWDAASKSRKLPPKSGGTGNPPKGFQSLIKKGKLSNG